MKSTKLVIVPTGMSMLGVFTSGKSYDIIEVELRPHSARVYYTSDSGREECAVFDADCVKDGMIKDGSKSPAEIWEVREVEIEKPLSEIDQIIATAQHYAEESAKRAIADALLPGGQIHAALRNGGYVSEQPIFAGEFRKLIKTMSDGEALALVAEILRVPEGCSVIEHAQAVRERADAMSDAMFKSANQ